MKESSITNYIPDEGLKLVKYSGKEFVDRLGLEIVQEVVVSILKGKNVRDLTENLTQRRILMLCSSIIVTYLQCLSSFNDFENKLSDIIKKDLSRKINPDEKTYLLWFLGLTGKSIQNVIRDSDLDNYIDSVDANLKEICKDVKKNYGDICISIDFKNSHYKLKWPNLLRCFFAGGAATLTTRGSEKSIYGKTFEKFVLGSVLTILGFSYIEKKDAAKGKTCVFWLSERLDKRESDATLLVNNKFGVRFDIGFIGKGNTEISLDKVTRFEQLMKIGKNTYTMSTIILVDNIGDNSRISNMAREINGYILQMRETYWVYGLAETLFKICKYKSDILQSSKEESLSYIEEKMKKIDLNLFFGTKR